MPRKRRHAPKKQRNLPLTHLAVIAIIAMVGLMGVKLVTHTIQASHTAKELKPYITRHHKAVCGKSKHGFADCTAHVVTNNALTPQASSIPDAGSLIPSQLHTAYNLPCTPGGSVQSACATPSTFGQQTIAIVDPFNSATIANDLSVYSTQFGLPDCTQANGCLTIINQNGGTSLPTGVDTSGGWQLETSLDVEMAHAICQTCKILLVEANSNSFDDLGTAVNTAATRGPLAISNSYGGSEFFGETSYNFYYEHPGIAVTASSGDNGFGAEVPAAMPHVIAVGGTTLRLNTDNTYGTETAWSGAGSGCSAYQTAASWQLNMPAWAQTGCGGSRAVADVAAVADPSTPVAVYDSTPYSGQTGWYMVGGTSVAAPIVAAEYALTGSMTPNTYPVSYPYTGFTGSNYHDVTSGSNGSCIGIMCNSVSGYDGPTGLGSAYGVLGFSGSQNTQPSATPTNTPVPSATLTPTPTKTGDTTAPTISITSPQNGAIVARGTIIAINASATDNVGVTKVVFTIKSAFSSWIHTDTSNPYQYSWKVPSRRNTQYTITAKAYDAAGNTSTNTITVTSSN